MATRWGIAGCGFISNMFVSSWKCLPKNEHLLVAAAARNLSDAQNFIEKHEGKKAYEGYQNLAKDPNVEIVYVGVITKYHMDVVLMMLDAGKHVLCEKPLAMNTTQTKKMVNLAREKKLFLMEGVWSRCFPVYDEIRRRIDCSDEIGEPVQISASLGFRFHLPRIAEKALGGSVTLDMGVYLVQFVLHIFGAQMPVKIVAAGHINDDGADDSMSAILLFSGGRTANISCTSKCQLHNEASIHGTKGILKVSDRFNSPESFTSPAGDFSSPLPPDEGIEFHSFQGLLYEAQEVRRCLNEGLLESPKMTLDETVMIATILEEILNQIGIDFNL